MGLTPDTKTPTARVGVRRPWKVFVRDIGPTQSFASAAKAHARAAQLTTDQFAEVLVYDVRDPAYRRTVYQLDLQPVDEEFRDGQWRRLAPAPPLKAIELGHCPVWDPPAAMTAAKRWTCGCGHAVLDYCGNVYGSATEVECPSQEGSDAAP